VVDVSLFLDRATEKLSDELGQLVPTGDEVQHWMVLQNSTGIHLSAVPDGVQPHELLSASIDNGAEAAAYVTYNPSIGTIVASVLIANPRNSDIRRASVARAGETVTLGPWEYTV
jgi:hypothetical protein